MAITTAICNCASMAPDDEPDLAPVFSAVADVGEVGGERGEVGGERAEA